MSLAGYRGAWQATVEPGRLQSMGHKELDMTKQLSLSLYFLDLGGRESGSNDY